MELLAAIRIISWLISTITFGAMAFRLLAVTHPLARLLAGVSGILALTCFLVAIRACFVFADSVPLEAELILTVGAVLCAVSGVVYAIGFTFLTRPGSSLHPYK